MGREMKKTEEQKKGGTIGVPVKREQWKHVEG
jgi:hypothetical protein